MKLPVATELAVVVICCVAAPLSPPVPCTNRAGVVTFSAAVPEVVPEVAVMVVAPALTPVAKPPEAIVAAAVFDEDQVTVEVRFCVDASE